MKCKKCGNNYCKLISQTKTTGKDFSILRGLVGESLFGESGYILGFSDSKNIDVKAYWICNKCGYKFET